MSYSRSVLLYQDEPAYGLLLKLIILIVPLAMLVGSFFLFSSGDSSDGLALLAEAFIIGLIFWAIFPRKYQVYEDHLRIVLGGPFSVKVRFDQVKAIEITGRLNFGVNFITKFTRNHVAIYKKRGPSIAITPRDNDLFVENANKALGEWVNTNLNKA